MSKYICTNKWCEHTFKSNEDKPIINCPICLTEILNSTKIITTKNWLFVESMFKNIQTYGVEGTFKMIDKCYHNATTRIRVRKMFFDTLTVLGKEIK